MNRIISTISALCLVLCLAGCTGSGVRTYTEPTEAPADAVTTDTPSVTDPSGTETPANSIDMAAACAAYAPETVVMTVNGEPVYWDEYFYWMQEAITLVNYYYGGVTDWNDPCVFDETITYAEYVREYADDTVLMYRTMEKKAAELGLELDEEDRAYLDELWQSDIDSIGSEEELLARLEELYLTRDIYYYINTISILADKVYLEQYGENGDKLAEEDVIEFGSSSGYMRVKHILYKTTDDNDAALSEEEIQQQLAAAQAAAAQVLAVEDPAEREALFDELMAEYSDDTGLAAYPDGYCFTAGDMVEEFYLASLALEEYGVSDPVESSYGYHVIMRLPLRSEDIPISDGVNTLRVLAATEMFNANVTAWTEELLQEFEPGFEVGSLDMSAIFAITLG